MKGMTLGKIAEACGGHLMGGNPDLEVQGVVSDSRQVEKDYLFLAIKGERVDGADFIGSVFEILYTRNGFVVIAKNQHVFAAPASHHSYAVCI